ncbi:clpC [Symbiodinium natans]|uniref:ClpC protein n=1 Tax=Symbiodinium natans TaxID=878477 RepID=A0A812S757_9DINO|nr:clpC [Symbiodinium natans]
MGAARLLLASLLVLPASEAVRTSALTNCDYKELRRAQVRNLSKGAEGVEVSFCGRRAELRKEVEQPSAWEAVDWWDATQQGASLTPKERETLENHLGSYGFSRAVGLLGRGLLPPLRPEDRATRFVDESYVSLVRSVLDFEVNLGIAVNKLPASKKCKSLWRGAWVSSEKLEELRAKAAQGQATGFSYFQSTTSNEQHSYKFLHSNHQPASCRPMCIQKNLFFPIHIHFRTRHGKDATKWNPKEKEWLVLPNLLFNVRNVSQFISDPLYRMNTQDLVAWLNATHPYRSWQDEERRGQFYGPFPRLAEEVRKRKMDGKGFSDWEVDGKYEMLDVEAANYRAFFDALAARYELPPREGRYGSMVGNEDPFIYKVELEDAAGCA